LGFHAVTPSIALGYFFQCVTITPKRVSFKVISVLLHRC
jgi:hypothetical protein